MERRLAISIGGVVQGVGFRPFVFTAAAEHGLSGWVRNGPDGVRLEVQGPEGAVQTFVDQLRRAPAPARVETVEIEDRPLSSGRGFFIEESELDAAPRPSLPADQATCSLCVDEILTPGTRRFHYPFTNCARCGPRYSLIEALPYDRARTTMKGFGLCAECEAEYCRPADRRFHAQPIACPQCGPALSLWERERARGVSSGNSRPSPRPSPRGRESGDALAKATQALGEGKVLALQGLGGFQLLVDATSPDAVMLLRKRKHREEKPFAVMVRTCEEARALCELSAAEEEALRSREAPILLLRRLPLGEGGGEGRVACPEVAPNNPRLGVMLPYTPLHRLLLEAVSRPLVCTSGNLSEEPMCIDVGEALARLKDVADVFLVHDRPIARPVDDSVARVGPDGLELLRRARGFAPLPLRLSRPAPCTLAVGAQLKSTVALLQDDQVVVSQHLGDLFSLEGRALLERTARDLVRFFCARPMVIACDAHPDYASTQLAEQLGREWDVPLVRVQHHHAHVAACVAEHGLSGSVLGLAWDGAGLGDDGTLWGGEALVVNETGFRRAGHLRPFRLPGGERAMREPRRALLGLLHEVFGAQAPAVGGPHPRALFTLLERGTHAPRTTSVGRLFDAVAALLELRREPGFEGQAAMLVEFAADSATDVEPYSFPLSDEAPWIADWEPLIRELLYDRERGTSVAVMSARFHESLAALAEAFALRAGLPNVVLSGGCFQNLRLATRVKERLRARGFRAFTPRLFPPNDGGISLGQAVVASRLPLPLGEGRGEGQ
ncbi:MAG: carbamoyltransferase HypF [Myxococcota bacterium]